MAVGPKIDSEAFSPGRAPVEDDNESHVIFPLRPNPPTMLNQNVETDAGAFFLPRLPTRSKTKLFRKVGLPSYPSLGIQASSWGSLSYERVVPFSKGSTFFERSDAGSQSFRLHRPHFVWVGSAQNFCSRMDGAQWQECN